MGSDWNSSVATEFCTSVRDGTHDSPKPVDTHGNLLVTSKHITGNRLDLANAYLISKQDFEQIEKRSKVDQWDVLITMIGTVGEACLVSEEPNYAIKNIGLFKSRGEIEGKYLYYFLRSPSAQHHIKTRLRGTTQQYIPLGELRNLPIPHPSSKLEMRAIAHILGTLDDKIELNRQMNATLEAMAKALFKSWFVDFDPVIDNALAAGNPIPEPLQERADARKALGDQRKPLPEAIQKQFPNRFVFNDDIGWVPEGWNAVNLSDLTTKISKGTTPRKTDAPAVGTCADVPFIKVKDMTDDGQILFDRLDQIPRSVHEGVLKRSVLSSGDVLFSIAGTIGRCSVVPEELNDSNTNQAVAFVRPNSVHMVSLILYFLKSETVQEIVSSRIVQAVQANFSLSELGGLALIVPNDSVLNAWDNILRPKLNRIDSLQTQNRQLARLRDTLLPKLLSGQLRISEAKQQIACLADRQAKAL